MPDHLADMLAPIPALIGAALAPKTLRVGTLVLNNDLRHPVLVAREAATVDLLSDGRLELQGRAACGGGHHHQEDARPPILIGGDAPRLLTLAAREADIVGLTGIAFRRGGAEPDVSAFRAARVDERVQLVREAAGIRHARLELNALVQRVVVTVDRRRAAAELPGRWAQLSPEEILQRRVASAGASSTTSSTSPTRTPSPAVVARLAGR